VKHDPLLEQAQAAVEAGLRDAESEVARLKREIAIRDDVLSLAAHELRNPLHALALHLALARTLAQAGNGADSADRIRRAELTLKRYTERVTVLMELLASPGAVYPLAPRQVDVAALLTGLVDSLDQEARSRGIDVVVVADLPASQRTRLVDTVAFEQVVDNLLLNSFKHSGATAVTIRLRSEPGFWSVQVEDNGSGIAIEDQQAVFEKFTVASHSSRGAGTGLGLWIVARLVQAMDGTVGLASAPRAGCVFTVRIPEGDDMSNSR
jgi:two-component system OmpR family sensor kinase